MLGTFVPAYRCCSKCTSILTWLLQVLQKDYAEAALLRQEQLLRLLRAAAAEGRLPAAAVEAAAAFTPNLDGIVTFAALCPGVQQQSRCSAGQLCGGPCFGAMQGYLVCGVQAPVCVPRSGWL